MEGDFRRPPRQPENFVGGRPRPQPSHRPRPIPVTDLRAPAPVRPPITEQTPPPQPWPKPQFETVPQPAAAQPSQIPVQPATPATTAELIAQHERETNNKPGPRRNLVLAAAGLLVVIVGAFFLTRHGSTAKKSSGPFPVSISSSQITIPVYYPKGLPASFKVSGYKTVKQDVLNYVVTNANNETFYVNIQPVPTGYDFSAFDKRFAAPTTFPTDIGSATEGLMNNELVCSIQTGKSWLMLNSTAVKSASDMETIAKALKPVSL